MSNVLEGHSIKKAENHCSKSWDKQENGFYLIVHGKEMFCQRLEFNPCETQLGLWTGTSIYK